MAQRGRDRNDERRARARIQLRAAGVFVLYEDNHVLCIAKPAGLASQGGGSIRIHVVSLLGAYRSEAEAKPGDAYVGLVHRLDRNVSGVMVTAKTSKAARRLSAAFRERPSALHKEYLAWVQGVPHARAGRCEGYLLREDGVTRVVKKGTPGAQEADLDWESQGRGAEAARLVIRLGTGRTHQIRAQLSHEGLPLFGDPKYGGPRFDRPALHAWRLGFPHPVRDGHMITLEAHIPQDLSRLDRRLGIRPPPPPPPRRKG